MPRSKVFWIAGAVALIALICVFALDAPQDHRATLVAGGIAAVAGAVAAVAVQMERASRRG